jgi:hypothetical protein
MADIKRASEDVGTVSFLNRQAIESACPRRNIPAGDHMIPAKPASNTETFVVVHHQANNVDLPFYAKLTALG